MLRRRTIVDSWRRREFRPGRCGSLFPSRWSCSDQRAFKAARDLIDHLLAMPLSDWLAIGHGLLADQESDIRRRAAGERVEAEIAHRRLGVIAWYLRDSVDTAAYYVGCQGKRWSLRRRSEFASTRAAAKAAVLGLLVQNGISGEDLRLLRGPLERWAARTP